MTVRDILPFVAADGSVWLAWTDFAHFGRRCAITDRDAALTLARAVSASIASCVFR